MYSRDKFQNARSSVRNNIFLLCKKLLLSITLLYQIPSKKENDKKTPPSPLKAKMARYIGIMYKIKHLLPIQARIQIYHSFVQSHINFCSLVWGFSSKSNIESLFTNQKKGMRAVMPGHVNFYYRNGVKPTHTKPFFNQFNVLTVQGIIVKYALVFMNKVYY